MFNSYCHSRTGITDEASRPVTERNGGEFGTQIAHLADSPQHRLCADVP